MATGRSCRDVGAAFDVAPSTAGNWYRGHQQTQIEQVFAKVKALLRRAAPRSFDAICEASKPSSAGPTR